MAKHLVFYGPDKTRYSTDNFYAWCRENAETLQGFRKNKIRRRSRVLPRGKEAWFSFYTNMLSVGYWRGWVVDGVTPKAVFYDEALPLRVLLSPDGVIYKSKNLSDFARKHVRLLRNDIRRAESKRLDTAAIVNSFVSNIIGNGKWYD